MQLSLNKIEPSTIYINQYGPNSVWKQTVELASGDIVFVKAPSGKGKSTLINVLYGLNKAYSGEYLLDNTSANSLTYQDWSSIRSKKLAVVFQNLQLIESLSVNENLALKNQLTNHKSVAEIKEFLEKLDMLSFWNKEVSKLSYGQKQRVAIVRALLQPFEFILLDEPFSHLDETNIDRCKELILQETANNNAGVIYTSLGLDYGFDYSKTCEI